MIPARALFLAASTLNTVFALTLLLVPVSSMGCMCVLCGGIAQRTRRATEQRQ
jgi:hypothetical protein